MDLYNIMADIGRSFPDIKAPERQLTFKEKITMTGIVVFFYFALLSIDVIGVIAPQTGLDLLQIVTASRIGSFLTLGIGPIVLASIFLQLLSGAGIIEANLKDPKEKTKFHEAQRTLTVVIALFEGIIFSTGVLAPNLVSVAGIAPQVITYIVALQLVLGAIIVMYLDEIITKHGIGSGISMFIAAGVSLGIVGGFITTFFAPDGVLDVLAKGGATGIGRALQMAIPFAATIAIFMGVAYGEGTKVKLPIHISVLGQSRPLELPLFYVSNIPVIFAAALLLNLELIGAAIAQYPIYIGDVNVMNYIAVSSGGRLIDGFLYLISPIRPSFSFAEHIVRLQSSTVVLGIPEMVHAVIYVIFLSLISIVFGLFWVETSSMDAKSMAEQLSSMGGGLRGFRFDKRLLEKRLEEYITPLTILGSFLVGLLAGLADLTGAYGTGTGILLTVGILYRFYLQIREGLEIYFPGIYSLLFSR